MLLKIFFILILPLIVWASNDKLDAIIVQLQWKHQFEFAGFYAAKEKGYYKKAGLDVTFLEYQNGLNIVDQVLQNNAQYGVGYSSIIADFYQDKPIVMLANFFKQSPLVLVTQKEITSPKQLKNKTIMGISDSIDNITLLQMLDKFGVKRGDYTNLPTDFSIDKFVHKEIDAMSVFITNETYHLNQKSVTYNVFNPAIFGVEYYDSNLFTSVSEIQNHPNRANSFTKATIKGWKYALSHQDEIINLILQKYNSQAKTKEALEFEAKQTAAVMLTELYPIGMIEKKRVQQIVNVFQQSGYIPKDASKDLDKFIYMTNQAFYSEWTIYKFLHYLNTQLIWKIVGALLLLTLLSIIINIVRKKQNRALELKIQEAIAEQKEKDQMLYHQSKLVSMGEMIENIAHQWRQPLSEINAIITTLDAHLEAKNMLDTTVETKLAKIEDLTQYMSQTISEFQEFYQPDKEKVSFLIKNIIENSLSIVETSLYKHNIRINTDIEQTPALYSYPNEIKQVLIIILNNAKDILMQRAIQNPSITIKAFQSQNYITISIEDNAGGIEPDCIEKVFEPYFSTKHKTQGTGLGLYMAKLIIEKSIQGVLRVSNTPLGARFEIQLKVIHD